MGDVAKLRQLDPETAALAIRLAEAMEGMRATSRFAVKGFLSALDEPGVVGASLTLDYEGTGRLEAKLEIGPR